jgi:hypothetical protein
MDFYPNSEIVIGTYRFSGVNSVTVKRSMNSLDDTATIKLPGRGYIQTGKRDEFGTVQVNPGRTENKNVGQLFAPGDKVTIKLGWNGELHEEFAGFVRRVGRGMPVEVECEGYACQMRDNVSVSGVLKEVTIKQLLDIATGKTDIKHKPISKPLTDIKTSCTLDAKLTNVQLDTLNGIQICEVIKSLTDNNVGIFFIKPDVLWCGLPFTAYADGSDPISKSTAGYRPGWNAIRDKELKQRVVDKPLQVAYGGKYATGTAVFAAGKNKKGSKKEKKMLPNVPEKTMLEKLAAEKEYRTNYKGYEGKISGFLQPYCQPGYKATIVNSLYPNLDGDYMVAETEVKFGIDGARRSVELGPVIGFAGK